MGFHRYAPKSKPPKPRQRFHGPFIIVKKLHKGSVIVRLQDDSQDIVNLDRCHAFKEQSMIEWTKDVVQSANKDTSGSDAFLQETRFHIAKDESRVCQIQSVLEEPEIFTMEKN